MSTALLAITLFFSNYHGSSLEDHFSNFGLAINEANCRVLEEEDNPSCIAYCESSLVWMSRYEINQSIGICEDIIGSD